MYIFPCTKQQTCTCIWQCKAKMYVETIFPITSFFFCVNFTKVDIIQTHISENRENMQSKGHLAKDDSPITIPMKTTLFCHRTGGTLQEVKF